MPKLPYPDMPYPAAPPPWDEAVTGLPTPFKDGGTLAPRTVSIDVTPDPTPMPSD
jgi:hypothetical protein